MIKLFVLFLSVSLLISSVGGLVVSKSPKDESENGRAKLSEISKESALAQRLEDVINQSAYWIMH